MQPCGVFNVSYGQEMAVVRTRLQWGILMAGLALLFVFPFIPGLSTAYSIWLLNWMAITVIVVLGLQIVTGYCGQVSFGQAAFMMVGAYSSAILTLKVGWPIWAALPLAGIITGLVGVVAGAPSLRIKGFYLALATLAAHFLLWWLIQRPAFASVTGGAVGLNELPSPTIAGFALDSDRRMFYLIMAVMVMMTFVAKNLMRTQVGRAFVAIRDNDLAAEVMGINVFGYKLMAFFVACFYAGIAGSLWAHWLTTIHPEQFFITEAIFYIGMIIIGGLGSISGVFFGVVFVRGLDQLMLRLGPTLSSAFPFLGEDPGPALSWTLFGLVLIVFLIFEPRGLHRRWEIFKAYYRLHPFSH